MVFFGSMVKAWLDVSLQFGDHSQEPLHVVLCIVLNVFQVMTCPVTAAHICGGG